MTNATNWRTDWFGCQEAEFSLSLSLQSDSVHRCLILLYIVLPLPFCISSLKESNILILSVLHAEELTTKQLELKSTAHEWLQTPQWKTVFHSQLTLKLLQYWNICTVFCNTEMFKICLLHVQFHPFVLHWWSLTYLTFSELSYDLYIRVSLKMSQLWTKRAHRLKGGLETKLSKVKSLDRGITQYSCPLLL